MERQRLKADPFTRRATQLSEPRFASGTIEAPPLRADDAASDAGTEGGDGGMCEEDVAQIVHDLRDPLATIALEMYVLDRKIAIGDHSDVRSTSARIIRNVEFLDRLIQDLLDSCCAAEGHFEIHRRPTELRALLEQVIARAVPTRDRGRVILDAPYPLMLQVDDLRIERVVANLVGNALKHAPPSSPIIVRLEAGALAARISVINGGPPLPAEDAAHIFDKYRRGSGARCIDGHGIGLHVSKQIVEAHGGRIDVDSLDGVGAQFYFELPVPPI